MYWFEKLFPFGWVAIDNLSHGFFLSLSSWSLLSLFLFFISFSSHLHFSVDSRSWNIYIYSQKHNLSHSTAILDYIVIFHWTLSLFHGFVQRNLKPAWEMSVCHNLVNPKHTWLVLIFDELLSIPRWTYNSP